MKKFFNLLCIILLSFSLTGCGTKDYKVYSSVKYYNNYLSILSEYVSNFDQVKAGVVGIKENITTLDAIKSNLGKDSKEKMDSDLSALVNNCENTVMEARNAFQSELGYINSFGTNKTEINNVRIYFKQYATSKENLDKNVNEFMSKNEGYSEKELEKVKLEYTDKELKNIITIGVNEYNLLMRTLESINDSVQLSMLLSFVNSYCQYNSYFFNRILMSCDKDTPKYRCINSLKIVYDNMTQVSELVRDNLAKGNKNANPKVPNLINKSNIEITNVNNNFSKI